MAESVMTANAMSTMILEAAGLPTDQCCNVNLRLNPGDIARLEVTYLVNHAAAEKIVQSFKVIEKAD